MWRRRVLTIHTHDFIYDVFISYGSQEPDLGQGSPASAA
jgi:hypothetical protein